MASLLLLLVGIGGCLDSDGSGVLNPRSGPLPSSLPLLDASEMAEGFVLGFLAFWLAAIKCPREDAVSRPTLLPFLQALWHLRAHIDFLGGINYLVK